MIGRVGALGAVLALCVHGCAPRGIVPVREGRTVDPRPLAERFAAYNAQPRVVRVQGTLRVRGQGRADFGARVAEGVGLRLDAVAGPFGTPVVALACRANVECRAYVPRRQRVYLDGHGAWAEWLGALLRGRVPQVGAPVGAQTLSGNRQVLILSHGSGWREWIEFDGSDGLPTRAVLGRGGEPEVEVGYSDYFDVAGRPFPGRVSVRIRELDGAYDIEFRRVEVGGDVNEGLLSLAVPPGTATESLRGSATWNKTGLPFWPPIPDG